MACLIRPFIRRATAPIPRRERGKEGFVADPTSYPPSFSLSLSLSFIRGGLVFSRIENLVAIVEMKLETHRLRVTIII